MALTKIPANLLDKSAHVDFADNERLRIGTDNDLQLYHDNSNAYITNSAGALKIATETSGTAITIGHTTSETTIADNLTVTGNLTVSGTTTEISTTNLQVEDKNIVLNYGSGDTSANANGAGITIQDAINASTDATLNWDTSSDHFEFSHPVQIESGSAFPTLTLKRSTTLSGLYFTAGISDFTGGGADLLFDGQGNETGFGFRPRNSSGTLLTGLVITPDGDVGLGTHSPGHKLQIQDDNTTAVTDATSLVNATTIGINGNTSSGTDTMRIGPMNTSGNYFIDVSNSGATANYDLHVNPLGGSLVIGSTSNPTDTFEVHGSNAYLASFKRASSTPHLRFYDLNSSTSDHGFIYSDNNEPFAYGYTTSSGGTANVMWQSDTYTNQPRKPIMNQMRNGSTDGNCKHYTHLATKDLYQSGTGYTIIDTTIPHYGYSNDRNMFMIRLAGYGYDSTNTGIYDFYIGAYVGENSTHNPTCGGNIPEAWRGNVYLYRNTSTNCVSIVLGTSSTTVNYSVAVTDFIQSFSNQTSANSQNWNIKHASNLSGYDRGASVRGRFARDIPAFRAYLGSSLNVSAGTHTFSGSSHIDEHFDKQNNYNASNGRFTAPQSGIYHFDATLTVGATTTSITYLSAEIVHTAGGGSGSTTRYIVGGWNSKPSTTNAYASSGGGLTLEMDNGDIAVLGYEVSAACTLQGGIQHTSFCGHLVG